MRRRLLQGRHRLEGTRRHRLPRADLGPARGHKLPRRDYGQQTGVFRVPLLSVAHAPLPILVQRASDGKLCAGQGHPPRSAVPRGVHAPAGTTSGAAPWPPSTARLIHRTSVPLRGPEGPFSASQVGGSAARFSRPFWERGVSPRARDPPRALRAPGSARPTRRRTPPPSHHQVASGRAQHYPTRRSRRAAQRDRRTSARRDPVLDPAYPVAGSRPGRRPSRGRCLDPLPLRRRRTLSGTRRVRGWRARSSARARARAAHDACGAR